MTQTLPISPPKSCFSRHCRPPILLCCSRTWILSRWELRHVLETANEPIMYSYFIDSGIASVVASNGNHRRRIEVGLVGLEGMTGLAVVLGSDRSPNENFMQVGGDGQAHKCRQAAGSDAGKSHDTARFSQFRPCLLEPSLKHRTVELHSQHRRAIGTMASLMAHDRLEDDTISAHARVPVAHARRAACRRHGCSERP